MPRPGHAHVRVQDDAVVERDLEVLAVRLHRLDRGRRPVGCGPTSRAASNATIGFPTNIVRKTAALRWIVSPSGMCGSYAASARSPRTVTYDRSTSPR